MSKVLLVFLFIIFFFLVDLYAFQGVWILSLHFSSHVRNGIKIAYWSISALCIICLILYHSINPDRFGNHWKMFVLSGLFIIYFSKLVYLLFLFIDDLQRMLRWGYRETSELINSGQAAASDADNYISRSQFLVTTGVIVASVPLISLSWGIISGAHDYRVRKLDIPLTKLPSAFDGLRIVQISDIHSGSFWNKTAVKAGVEMAVKLKPDLIFFTGDLVNNRADEMAEWISVFSKLTAPLGVYSILGNHDYGDYTSWNSPEQKRQNLHKLMQIHKVMGWDLLMDEHRIKEVEGQKLAIIGVQNWGAKARFPKYGNLAKAAKGIDSTTTNLLLSHDPSHWKAQVLPEFPQIDLTFSGHTHGMQFGVEIPGFKWSPAQYVYDEWAGLYREDERYLYVNRGFGYLGYPGRVGIPPEISLITIRRKPN